MGYWFLWAPVVLHLSGWIMPHDLWATFSISALVAHGHVSSIYTQHSFVTFPGIAFVLAPISALAHALHLGTEGIVLTKSAGFQFVDFIHPSAWVILGPLTLLMSMTPLFACDALAERLGVNVARRWLLVAAEAVALWNVSVLYGHPEDAIALGLALYALIFVMDKRWNGAGWLFGAALALQPLVLLMLPVLLAAVGTRRWRGFLIRSATPAIVVLAGPLVTNFHATWTTLTEEPNFPLIDHQTPWTALAPRLHEVGGLYLVAGGPGRVVALLVACAVGWWARRVRDRPDALVWAVALALAVRCLTESVMDPYYLWPAIAAALVVSSTVAPWRFAATVAASTFITFSSVSQWHLGWAAWWTLNVGGLVLILISAAPLHEVETSPDAPTPVRTRARTPQQRHSRHRVVTKRKSHPRRKASRR